MVYDDQLCTSVTAAGDQDRALQMYSFKAETVESTHAERKASYSFIITTYSITALYCRFYIYKFSSDFQHSCCPNQSLCYSQNHYSINHLILHTTAVSANKNLACC